MLRTTHNDDAVFARAVDVLYRYMRALADAECQDVTEDLERLRARRFDRLPEYGRHDG